MRPAFLDPGAAVARRGIPTIVSRARDPAPRAPLRFLRQLAAGAAGHPGKEDRGGRPGASPRKVVAIMVKLSRPARWRGGPATGPGSLEVMPAAPDGVAEAPEEGQDQADQQQDDADGPGNGDLQDEPDDEKYETENNHGCSLALVIN
jgi:hypothetical protein